MSIEILISKTGLAISGVSMTIVATVISELLVRRFEREAEELESKSNDLSVKLEFSAEQENTAKGKFQFAQLLIALVQSHPALSAAQHQIGEAVQSILSGIADRNSAVTLEPPPQDLLQQWAVVAERAKRGDADAFQELSSISQALLVRMPETRNSLAAKRASYQKSRPCKIHLAASIATPGPY